MLCIVCSVTFSLARFDSIPIGSLFDDAHYIVLAESLSKGTGYRLISYPDAPVETAFPPGWPLLLTPLFLLASDNLPDNFTALKLLSLGLWLACIPLVYKVFATRLQPPHPFAVTTLVASNSLLIGMAGTVMSEAAYLFFSLLALYLFERWRQHGEQKRAGVLVAALVLALVTTTVRTIGIALLAGMLVYLLVDLRLHRKWRQVAMVTGLLILGTVPLAWFNGLRGGSFIFSPLYQAHVAYVSENVIYFTRFWEHAPKIPYRNIAISLIPMLNFGEVSHGLGPMFNGLFNGGVLLLAAWGFLLALRQRRSTELYVLFYVSILYVWIVYTDELRMRLLIPLLPFGYFYLVRAFEWIAQRFSQDNRRTPAWVLAGCLCGALLLNLGANVRAWSHPTRERVPDLTLGTTWVRQHAPDDAVLMTANPIPDYLYARRQTVHYPGIAAIDLDTYLAEHGVDYILVRPDLNRWDNPHHELDWYAGEILLPTLMAHPERFQKVYTEPSKNITLYQLIP